MRRDEALKIWSVATACLNVVDKFSAALLDWKLVVGLFDILIWGERFNATKENTEPRMANANKADDRNGPRSVARGGGA